MNHIIEFRNPIQKAARESVQSKSAHLLVTDRKVFRSDLTNPMSVVSL